MHCAAVAACRAEAMKKAVAMGGGGGGGGKGGTAPTDLLVCFPARQHLALMPKPICSPSRTTMNKAAAARRRQVPGASVAGGVRARGSSPMFRGSNAKQTAEDDDEPQSPKVTCAGQIKVGRPKKPRTAAAAAGKNGKEGGGGGRSWLTVVEEIEQLHGRRKKMGWLETVGIRRDALPFLGGALRSLLLKARCFGSLHGAVESSTDDDDGAVANEGEHGAGGSAAASVFSKWLMVLEGGQEALEQDSGEDDERQSKETDECSSAPPPNALLLMRCRSAPAKGLSRRGTGEPPAGEVEQEKGSADAVPGDGHDSTEEDRGELVFVSTAPGFLKLSIDIAQETWVVGGMDPLVRSRSWKR
ncbi:uncharacterized protein LOC133897591 [Phragmites australis]|uniref:uncharacterized protein LOC133897591 n=1 Tax=Phragmites australis TaxID=29695 RepID=UPI002D79ADD2|nr:uncharacterized protein LOC133897591 [Phragmites australis]